MANMNFGVNILPQTNNTYALGNSSKKWNLYVNQINGEDYHSPTITVTTTNASASDALTAAAQTLYDGQLVFIILNEAMSGSANATIQFGTASALNIYLTANTRLQAPYAANSILGLLYKNGNLYMINPPIAV